MIHLVCGPPAAGKNTYVDSKKQDRDLVIDYDLITQLAPTQGTAKALRETLEESAREHLHDTWVIRTLANAQARTDVAKRLGAEEVVIIATPADIAKQWAQERDPSTDLSEPIDRWWSEYSPSDEDLVVEPDLGTPSDKEKKLGDLNTDESDKGFPANTPVADMTAEQQIAYWKHYARKHEDTVKSFPKDYEDQKAAADQWRQHEQANKPDNEKELEAKLEAAREEGRKETLTKNAPKLVRSAFESRAAGKVDAGILEAFLEDMNHTKYVKDDGEIDTDGIQKRVDALAPKPTSNSRTHQGARRQANTSSSMEAGRELHDRVHGKKN